MNKTALKVIAVISAATLAVVVCGAGLLKEHQRQYERRLDYAKATLADEQAKIKDLERLATSFYIGKNQDFLNQGIQSSTVEKATAQLDEFKTTAADFAIKPTELPKTAKTLAKEKTALLEKLEHTSEKLQLQNRCNELFNTPIVDWTDKGQGVIIKETATLTEAQKVIKQCKQFKDDAWYQNITNYLNAAVNQINEVNTAQQIIDTLTSEKTGTYDDYLNLIGRVENIQNNEIRIALEQKIPAVASALGIAEDAQITFTTE
ncbi:MAG: hypothetical protein LBS33_03030 [Streptococcaceae bacterium]|nr:hypothetical protein [Streptococcaceae bacterium]